MNCPTCNRLLTPTKSTRTTTGARTRFSCQCGASFTAYKPAGADTWQPALRLKPVRRWIVPPAVTARAVAATGLRIKLDSPAVKRAWARAKRIVERRIEKDVQNASD